MLFRSRGTDLDRRDPNKFFGSELIFLDLESNPNLCGCEKNEVNPVQLLQPALKVMLTLDR